MKMKKVWRILSIVVAIVLALGMTAFAEGEKKAVAKIGGATVNGGEEFELIVSFENCESVKAFMLNDFEFGGNISIVDAKSLVKGVAIDDWNGERYVAVFEKNTNINGEAFKFKLKVVDDPYADEGKVSFNAVFRTENEDEEIVIPSEVVSDTIIVNGTAERPKTDGELIADRKQNVVALKINAATAYAYGKTAMIDPDNSKVVPYLKNDRTLVPLRFVSETLGAEVQWENGWNYCYVVKGDKKIKITFNSADIEVNGEVVTYDAPVEVVQDRTMVPIRFISEQLGYDVKWNQANQLVIITPADNPWNGERQAEKDVLEGILVTFLFNGIF